VCPCGRTLTFYTSLSEKTVVILNCRCMLRSGRDCHMCQKWCHLTREPELTNPTTFIRTQWIDQTNRVICIGGRGRRYYNCIRYHGWIFNTYVYKWHTGMGKFDPQQVNYCRVEARQLMVQCGGWIWASVDNVYGIVTYVALFDPENPCSFIMFVLAVMFTSAGIK